MASFKWSNTSGLFKFVHRMVRCDKSWVGGVETGQYLPWRSAMAMVGGRFGSNKNEAAN